MRDLSGTDRPALERALHVALEAIDRVNSGDPNQFDGRPLALAQAIIATEWLLRLEPSPGAPLRLAVRAHHLARWTLPRGEFPDGRAGYLRWRAEQKRRHGRDLTVIGRAAGLPDELVARAAAIVAKTDLRRDPEVQMFEDAVTLTFLQTQLGTTAERLGPDKAVDVLTKTLAKMTAGGRALAPTVPLPAALRELVTRLSM